MNRRAEQRRADSNFALYKKQYDGSRFKIKTKAAGYIVTNKLCVTSMLIKLMEVYLDVAQVHYEDNDERFVLVESIVRSYFEFAPLLKPCWFPTYMRKKLEKNRFEFHKHFKATGQRHLACREDKHPALLAWWSSPAVMSKSHRLKELNAAQNNQRRQ